jgi:hypothetical protein
MVDERIPADGLFDVLYAELHRLARRELNRRQRGGGLGVTTLLHEAYLKISAAMAPCSSTVPGSWRTLPA